MSTRKLNRAIQALIHQIRNLAYSITKGVISWLLRNLLIVGRQPLFAKSGFVLPTVVLLLLVVTLSVGSIGYRTYTRSVQTIGERQQRVIYNAATPAIDRAKAKLEYLFDVQRDQRFPGGVPAEDYLAAMMLNDGKPVGGVSITEWKPNNYDPYTFQDEVDKAGNVGRLDLDNDGRPDNAWQYKTDTDGDGVNDALVVYSIVFRTPTGTPGEIEANMRDSRAKAVLGRSQKSQVRQAPLSNAARLTNACSLDNNTQSAVAPIERGWFQDSNSAAVLRKNFQVDAYVLPIKPDGTPDSNGTVSTLEFQQDRQLAKGNRWGAWFRNDLEIFPGPPFNWNGAMHTEGSLIVGGGNFVGYMISSPKSCLYDEISSQITVANTTTVNTSNGSSSFFGHFISGTVKNNTYDGTGGKFHIFTAPGKMPITDSGDVELKSSSDSARDSAGKPTDFTLDPIKLQTAGISAARNLSGSGTDDAFRNTLFYKNRRMLEQSETPPFVDDSYRADNRYGPKPTYAGKEIKVGIGTPIAADPVLIGNDPAAGQDDTGVGLDGYWERRARRGGLRVIVGQRLELGDNAGWGGPPIDKTVKTENEPLLPYKGCLNPDRCGEARQRRSLWDNLAAVQATAVYYPNQVPGPGISTPNPDVPAACLATTVHPGTSTTLENSSTFGSFATGGLAKGKKVAGSYADAEMISDFFRGRGTNGWEYNVPDPAVFATKNTPMMNALRNLAYFAGDSLGGAPSFPPAQVETGEPNAVVHPYPAMAMWGDFSILRRVIDQIDKSASYSFDALSPADKSTLYTSACTMGMLAFNIDYLEKMNLDALSGKGSVLGPEGDLGLASGNLGNGKDAFFDKALRGAIRSLIAGRTGVPAIDDPNNGLAKKIQLSSSDWVNQPGAIMTMLNLWLSELKNAEDIDRLQQSIAVAEAIMSREQLLRDRRYGFREVFPEDSIPGSYCPLWAKTNSDYKKTNTKPVTGAPPSDFYREPLQLLCSTRTHYPILHSLFTTYDTNGDASTTPGVINYAGVEPHGEDVEGRTRFQTDSYINKINGSANIYQVIKPSDLVLKPRSLDQWQLPKEVMGNANAAPLSNRDNLIKCTAGCLDGGTGTAKVIGVAFKDAAFMNGREMMNVRTLDLNLDLMRKTQSTASSNFWLPQSGVIYAFREDAVSENSIVRPNRSTWKNCNTDTAIQNKTGSCRMNTDAASTSAFSSTDPPVNPANLISPKAVDYFADPDRRPHGFRLRRGATLVRNGDNGRGLSFISDNPVYIQGNFNLHRPTGSTSTTTVLEEFDEPLNDNYTSANFYGRKTHSKLFARAAKDDWRPSEILADGVTVLSDNFCDGSIEDGFLTAGKASPGAITNKYGCLQNANTNPPDSVVTSYLNQNRPSTAPEANPKGTRWMRLNVADVALENDSGTSPIFVSRSGNPFRWNEEYSDDYYAMSADKTLGDALAGTRINSIIISGIVPSRTNQAYGGLHNFPRFLEYWKNKKLYMSGSFIQLNFSNYATGPFDQDSFEAGAAPQSSELIKYYEPPDRIWGYDVGLQYAPAGPIAQRFVTSQAVRSEFYNEPPANDPYIYLLCRQVNSNCPLPPGQS